METSAHISRTLRESSPNNRKSFLAVLEPDELFCSQKIFISFFQKFGYRRIVFPEELGQSYMAGC